MLTTTFQHRRQKQPPIFLAPMEVAKPNFSADFRRTLQNTEAAKFGGAGVYLQQTGWTRLSASMNTTAHHLQS